MEFFRSCYYWVAENYKEITMTLTSAQFISIISTIVLLLRNLRKTNDNVTSSNNLNSTLKVTNQMSTDVTDVKTVSEEIKTQNVALDAKLAEFKKEVTDVQESLIKKLNCMLEVQSIVYSTIKDDTIRGTVNSVLTNAKYAETETRAKLKEEVANLKAKLAEETEKVKAIADSATETITKIVEPETTPSDFVRY
jgi:hypothetical protein